MEILLEKFAKVFRKGQLSLNLTTLSDIWINEQQMIFSSTRLNEVKYDIGDLWTGYGRPNTNILFLNYNLIEPNSEYLHRLYNNSQELNRRSNTNGETDSLLVQPTIKDEASQMIKNKIFDLAPITCIKNIQSKIKPTNVDMMENSLQGGLGVDLNMKEEDSFDNNDELNNPIQENADNSDNLNNDNMSDLDNFDPLEYLGLYEDDKNKDSLSSNDEKEDDYARNENSQYNTGSVVKNLLNNNSQSELCTQNEGKRGTSLNYSNYNQYSNNKHNFAAWNERNSIKNTNFSFSGVAEKCKKRLEYQKNNESFEVSSNQASRKTESQFISNKLENTTNPANQQIASDNTKLSKKRIPFIKMETNNEEKNVRFKEGISYIKNKMYNSYDGSPSKPERIHELNLSGRKSNNRDFSANKETPIKNDLEFNVDSNLNFNINSRTAHINLFANDECSLNNNFINKINTNTFLHENYFHSNHHLSLFNINKENTRQLNYCTNDILMPSRDFKMCTIENTENVQIDKTNTKKKELLKNKRNKSNSKAKSQIKKADPNTNKNTSNDQRISQYTIQIPNSANNCIINQNNYYNNYNHGSKFLGNNHAIYGQNSMMNYCLDIPDPNIFLDTKKPDKFKDNSNQCIYD